MQIIDKEEIKRIDGKKFGDYTSDNCPECGRDRVILGADNKRRCEKCTWCIEDNEYDPEMR